MERNMINTSKTGRGGLQSISTSKKMRIGIIMSWSRSKSLNINMSMRMGWSTC